ncbi:hypothetical protein [uncultured Caulobacter sp.]|uniref:hypothetical protein n=1 Tax=uncultured Caulobacter sp. TaxID=158749 RepID=UPI0026240B80|nr:hypothetical protein [uncultured Caulobacter sp.]
MSEDISFDSIKYWKQRAENVSLGLHTMLARTDYVHPAVALMAGNGKVLVDHLISDLTQLEGLVNRDELPDLKLISDIIGAHTGCQELLELFDDRMRSISLALDRGGDMLPLQELTPWSVGRRGS